MATKKRLAKKNEKKVATKVVTPNSTEEKEEIKVEAVEQVEGKKDATKVEEKVEESKKAEPKKTVAKKATTAKKVPARKTTTKKVPKNVYVEFWGGQKKVDVDAYEKRVKDIWLNDWNRLAKDLKKIDLYIKPEDNKVYFVVNDTENGDLEL